MDEVFLVSGIGPGDEGGVGRLMKRLKPAAEQHGFKTLYPESTPSIRRLLERKRFVKAFLTLGRRWKTQSDFLWRAWQIRDARIIFLHPQTAGFRLLFRLIRLNKVFLYVMDNGFFCIRSYNMDPGNERECILCLGNPDAFGPDCKPFPAPMRSGKNAQFLKHLQKQAGNVHFLAQNNRQADLLYLHFGPGVMVTVVGMDTGEISEPREWASLGSRGRFYDLVYHGAPLLPKGLRFFIELAELLPEMTALVPSSREDCQIVLGRPIEAANIEFRPCNWETGLMEAVQGARLVVNPSLWSAPIEGALLKSIAYGRAVATVQTEYGFEAELSRHVPLLRLAASTGLAAAQIRDFLANNISHGEETQFKQVNVDIFELVEEQGASQRPRIHL